MEFQEEIQELRPEFNVYNRVGASTTRTNIIIGDNGRIDRLLTNPLDIFQSYVESISRDLISEGIREISERDINTMLEISNKLMYPKYKNPSAYVLGYIASNGGREITKTNFNYVKNKILAKQLLEDKSVLEPDVLRYARLWLSLAN